MANKYGISIFSLNPDLATSAGIDAIGRLGAMLADDLGTLNSIEGITKLLTDTPEEVRDNFAKMHPDVEIRVWPIG